VIAVLIGDASPVVRCGLRQILAAEKGLVVAGEADSAASVLDLVRHTRGDVLLLDLEMPDGCNLELLTQVQAAQPTQRIVVFTTCSEELFAVRALQAGAAAYLNKRVKPEELIQAVRKAASGGKYLTPAVSEWLAHALARNGHRPAHEYLSDREFQVLRLLASGESVSHIAERMYLSVKTVSTYRSRLLRKLGLRNTPELMRYAIRNGLG
jgi:DNA-binding NarL/FixJ family response regulator